MQFPIGFIGHFSVPGGTSGWLEAGGQAISRTKYVDLHRLYAAHGYPYGSGDGSTTFNLPDLRGRVMAGPNSMGGDTQNRLTGVYGGGVNGGQVGNTGGEQGHALEQDPLETPVEGNLNPAFSGNSVIAAGTDYSSSVTISGTVVPHNNVQPTIIIPVIVYTGVLD